MSVQETIAALGGVFYPGRRVAFTREAYEDGVVPRSVRNGIARTYPVTLGDREPWAIVTCVYEQGWRKDWNIPIRYLHPAVARRAAPSNVAGTDD